jgi:ribose-phosphate pyrophosphokinase
VSGESLIGDVKDRSAIILDDLISTGGTLARSAKACRAHGAARVYAAATHGLFVGTPETLLGEMALDQIVVTDTVPPFRLPAEAIGTRVVVLDTAPLIAEAIRRIHTGDSLVALMDV